MPKQYGIAAVVYFLLEHRPTDPTTKILGVTKLFYQTILHYRKPFSIIQTTKSLLLRIQCCEKEWTFLLTLPSLILSTSIIEP